jgi:hypothetical protein
VVHLKLKDFNSHDQGLSSVFWEKPLRRQPWIDFVDDMFYAKKPCLQFRLRFKHIYGGQRKAFLIKTNGGMYCHRQERNFANKEKDGSYIFLHQHAGPGSDRQRIRR